MSAFETFDWIVEQFFPRPRENQRQQIEGNRDYLLSLRSEDERQRFVEELMKDLKAEAAGDRRRSEGKQLAGEKQTQK